MTNPYVSLEDVEDPDEEREFEEDEEVADEKEYNIQYVEVFLCDLRSSRMRIDKIINIFGRKGSGFE